MASVACGWPTTLAAQRRATCSSQELLAVGSNVTQSLSWCWTAWLLNIAPLASYTAGWPHSR